MLSKKLFFKFTALMTSGLMMFSSLSTDLLRTRSEKAFSDLYSDKSETATYDNGYDQPVYGADYGNGTYGKGTAFSYADIDTKSVVFANAADAQAAGYLTPQQFKESGDADYTNAFKKMFMAAFNDASSFTMANEFKKCRPIFIPAGKYIISDTIISKNSGLQYAAFEVFGAGRESTIIIFQPETDGKVMFEDQPNIAKDRMIPFGFTTFHDIRFDGGLSSGNSNTFMTISDNCTDKNGNQISDSGNNGVQRMQFISCAFTHWKQIIYTVRSYVMLSEFTFAFCKIANCGNVNYKCRLFTLNDPQAVNWRFVETDIESFVGEAFYFERGAELTLIGGSVIPTNGTVFFMDFNSPERVNESGQSNSPHVYCDGTRFEIKAEGSDTEKHSCLLKSTSISKGTPQATFHTCNLNTGSNHSSRYLELNGAANILFDNCYDCSQICVTGNLNSDRSLNPQIKFVNCPSLNVDNLVKNSSNIQTGSNVQNCCRVIVDDTYDFYLKSGTYAKSITGLHECRQNVNLTIYSNTTLKNGRKFPYQKNGDAETVIPLKPYGYVKYVELTTIGSDTYKSYSPVTLTFYNGTKQIGEPVQISLTTSQTHLIVVNDFVDELTFVVSHSNSNNPEIGMDMEIVKY